MAIEIKKVLRRVEIVQDVAGKNAEVEWENQLWQDGVCVNRWTHRTGYSRDRKGQFLVDVDGGSAYLGVLGW